MEQLSDTPLVSVLTPSYNQGRWLEANLHSVALQDYTSVEHIVKDGGSTDTSLEILRRAGASVRWSTGPDRGQSSAINAAFFESRGEIIGWLNSDDAYFHRSVITRVVEAFRRNPTAAAVYGHSALVNADDLMIQMIWVPPFSYALLRTYNFIVQPAAFVRRSIVGPTLVDEAYDYMMDRELWLRIGMFHKIQRLDDVIAIDRHHLGRKSYTRLDLASLDTARLVRSYRIPDSTKHRVITKTIKIVFRLFGLSLVRRRSQLESGWRLDSPWLLALRQIAVPRRRMPVDRREPK